IMSTSDQALGVRLQQVDGSLAAMEKIGENARYLLADDIDGAGEMDLLAGDAGKMRIFYSPSSGRKRAEPTVLYVSSSPLGRPALADMDGNGHLDLVYPSGQRRSDVMLRLQESPRKWALESGFEVSPIAGFTLLPAGAPRQPAGMVAVDARTQELRMYALQVEERPDALFDGPWFLALDPQVQSGQELLAGADINGDERMDLLAASPRAAEMALFIQEKDGRFTNRKSASLSDINGLTVAGESDAPVVLASSGREETIGASVWRDKEGLSVPRMLDTDHKPLALCAADIDNSGRDDGLFVFLQSEEDEGRRSLMLGIIENPDARDVMGKELRYVRLLEDAQAAPTEMTAGDINGDGLVDLMVYYAYQPLKIFLQDEDGEFLALDTDKGLLKGVFSRLRPGQVAFADVNGDKTGELLVAQESFVRAYRMRDDQTLELVEQFNGRNVSARIGAVLTARIDGKRLSVIMLDSANQIITCYTSTGNGQWGEALHYDLEGLRAERMLAGDFNGDKRDDLVLHGGGKIRLFVSAERTRRLQTVWRRAPEEDDEAKYVRVDTVRLFENRPPTLLALEGTQHLLDMYRPGMEQPERYFHFKVFDDEQSISRSREIRGTPEPREFMAPDVDGDGLNDLVVLTHDNILYYRRYER
ncbi:MAG: FG-GAP repeat domain-containing protein, partial [Candidatus Sumerlaeota bacterium]